MSLKPAKRRVRVREIAWLFALAALLVYTYAPRPALSSADPVGRNLGTLRTGSPANRVSAATELGRMASSDPAQIIPALLQALSDPDPQVRHSALSALHMVPADDARAPEVASALARMLRDTDSKVRALAAGILPALKPDPKSVLPELIAAVKPDGMTPSAAQASSPPQAAEASIARSQLDHAKASAVTALGAIGAHDPEVHKILIALAGDPIPEVRMAVARTLGDLGPEVPDALAAELRLASDPDIYIQARAITALGSFPNDLPVSCQALYRAYLSKQRQLQEGAELSLDRLTKFPAFDTASAARSPTAALRFAAIYATNPNSDNGFQRLVQALEDEGPGVRIMAATRLAGVSSGRAEAALKALETVAGDKDEDVRSQVERSRSHLTPRQSRSSRP
jgi:HEAT repeat protein